jgi:hypothetical protein
MGIYLGQMPPAEMARLKAEMAETLIANFAYPRFYDYRANALRMRPVDRAKRQEVWTFLNSFDFNAFSRIDVTSPDFQRQVERLLIQFVQRNRAFFGQQGRKRMADVRTLITSTSISVTEGLRGHLSGRATTPFGSARPVTSWSKPAVSGRLEPGWEQIVNSTILVQQQLQEVRGEIRPGVNGDARLAAPPATPNVPPSNGATAAPPRRSPRLRATTQAGAGNETATPQMRSADMASPARPSPQDQARMGSAPSGPLQRQPSGPLSPQAPSAPAERARPSAPSTPLDDKASSARQINSPAQSSQPAAPPVHPIPVPPFEPPVATQPLPSPASPASPVSRAAAPQRELTRSGPLSPNLTGKADNAAVLVSDEDVVIFEEMRHQLMVWLRVEVVRAGVELTGQSSAQLLEILGQQDGADETRLQIVSTLLGLANQVIANRYATLVEYKQSMMFYLIHTRRTR